MDKIEMPDLSGYELETVIQVGSKMTLNFKKVEADFYMSITGDYESVPKLGDLSIFWDNGREMYAFVAPLADKGYSVEYHAYPYMATTQKWYQNAIKFRDPKQLASILTCRFREREVEEK